MRTAAKFVALGTLAIILMIAPLSATILKQMNLADLAGNANRIFSGTVVEIGKGDLAVGGGKVATVTYRVIVDNSFRGDFVEKEGRKIAEIKMVTAPAPRRSGGQVSFSVLP